MVRTITEAKVVMIFDAKKILYPVNRGGWNSWVTLKNKCIAYI